MTDYISREAALDALCKASTPCFSSAGKPILVFDVDYVPAINSIPAADVREVVRGKWIKYAPHNSDMMTCSECEKYWILDGDQYDYHFCPNCGAVMEES